MILDKINKPNDIKEIPAAEREQLADEIREFLLEKVSKTGGHLASNLGVVELTMALHLSFDLPKDRIIWDVGHQSYTHKLLTGRKDGFDNMRHYGGISGFPNMSESKCDAFTSGHSSTSISAGLGLAKARDLSGEDYHVVSVIGDGALTGGMAYEALNNASRLKSNFIIVLNDNNMSIAENIGSVSRMMTSIRTAPAYNTFKAGVVDALEKMPSGSSLTERLRSTKSSFKQLFIPNMFFEDMGITYLGPVDGYDIDEMVKVFEDAKRVDKAVVVHVMTKKGKGYTPAEKNPEAYHGVGTFNVEGGIEANAKPAASYSKVFGAAISQLAERNNKVVCITAAMADGVGLGNYRRKFADRFFDVGIAEEHAVTFAAGLAAGGMKPYVCVYSSFLQRAYDQIIHDVCLQSLPVTFMIDRAGIVGTDGETHQGIFDLSFLSGIPGMTVLAPKNAQELVDAVRFSEHFDGPLAIRYPRGTAWRGLEDKREPITFGKAEVLKSGSKVALLAVGTMVQTAMELEKELSADGISATVVNARFVHPFDEELVISLAENHQYIFTLEENVKSGGFGEHVAAFAEENNLPAHVASIALPDGYVEHGDVSVLKEALHVDTAGILENIRRVLR